VAEPPSVSTERVVAILCRDPLGSALWRAAVSEATSEALMERLEQLEPKPQGE
jgi:hypothetical protein